MRALRWAAPAGGIGVLGALALVAGTAGPGDASAGRPEGGPPPSARKVVQARALAQAPDLLRAAAEPAFAPADVRRVVRTRMKRIPLPRGGTFDGIRWQQAGGPIPASDMEAALEYNARCQWLRARRDGRETATAQTVLASADSWPALRAGPAGPSPLTPHGASLLVACDASHRRETAEAARLGLVPST